MNDLQDITIPFSFLGGGEGVSEGDLKAKSPLSHSPNRPIGFTAALHKDLIHENLPLNGSFAARAYAASTSGKLAVGWPRFPRSTISTNTVCHVVEPGSADCH